MKMQFILPSLTMILMLPAYTAAAQTFEEALASAFNNSPQLLAQRARARAIDENLVQAKASGLPTSNIDADIGALYTDRRSSNQVQGDDDFDLVSSNSIGVSLNQPLYQGGRVSGLKSEARSQILSAREDVRDAEQTTLLAAATAYVDVLRDENLARLRRNSVRILSNELEAVQERFGLGEGTRTDIAQAQTRLQETSKGLSLAEASLARSRAAFVRSVGSMPYDLKAPPAYPMPDTLEEAIQIARQNNPRLASTEHLVDAAQAGIDISKSALRPAISINSRVRTAESEFSNLPRSSSADVALQVRIPLYSGGLNRSRVRAAKETKAQLGFEARDLERALDQTVANIWSQWVSAQDILAASEKQVETAKLAFDGVKLEYGVGTRTALDVLNAEQEMLNAELSVHSAKRDVRAFSYQLLAALGNMEAQNLNLPIME